MTAPMDVIGSHRAPKVRYLLAQFESSLAQLQLWLEVWLGNKKATLRWLFAMQIKDLHIFAGGVDGTLAPKFASC